MSPHGSHGSHVRQSIADGLIEIAGTISMSRRRAQELHQMIDGERDLYDDMRELVQQLERTSIHIHAFRSKLAS